MGNTHYEILRNKWIKKHKDLQKNLWEKHGNALNHFANSVTQIAAGSLGGIMLLTSPVVPLLPAPQTPAPKENIMPKIDKNVFLITDLHNVLPSDVAPLTTVQEEGAVKILTRDFGLKIAPELSGIRLNRSYGYIGQEQHLTRFPGDTMASHFSTQDAASEFGKQGMAPGLGAWGYFARSADTMTEKDNLFEKYYIAVPTFLAPGFSEHTGEYITFFKYRKMIVVNPNNGRAIVVVIGDAGPAEFTGKHLGGSPEVMQYLERVDGAQKGAVLYFFIDDPNDTVPLGPIDIK
ncbi:MAG: hypothetical protein COX79_04935 [Candidatus Levybacteria bacterium CG_4_10_14_0_2_um_filter_36_16]|nr:MAG: hypothetical protein AUK12_00060 [Candidatus Levybacteria bacterium CG2_30_37_29]PIR78876.1 MAG: hypothetical protein COU26_04265 [Candidatus Levybacteria bacterium CG10_big_fil_rev_8_21_14_0_10_36_30]PIZ96540.1 MAG: hypothetical protein COX79_04935 [Candidatus Levybacteria bacterium CG_4_10_14_0_2_um_filter_36_16]